MTEEQLEAMRAGRERAQQRRCGEARKRVSAYQEWLRAERNAFERRVDGTVEALREHHRVLGAMPVLPTDADYRLTRGDAS